METGMEMKAKAGAATDDAYVFDACDIHRSYSSINNFSWDFSTQDDLYTSTVYRRCLEGHLGSKLLRQAHIKAIAQTNKRYIKKARNTANA